MSASDHKAAAPEPGRIRVVVLTVSDTRTLATDEGGALAEALAAAAGFTVIARDLVPDEPAAIAGRVRARATGGEADAADVILVTGGTGLAPRDRTIEAITPLLDRRIDGFGELFRALSFAEIGPAAMLSRALGGCIGQVAVFVMPGSPAAVRLAMTRLVLPELPHLCGQLQGGGKPGAALSSRHHHHGDGHRT